VIKLNDINDSSDTSAQHFIIRTARFYPQNKWCGRCPYCESTNV